MASDFTEGTSLELSALLVSSLLLESFLTATTGTIYRTYGGIF